MKTNNLSKARSSGEKIILKMHKVFGDAQVSKAQYICRMFKKQKHKNRFKITNFLTRARILENRYI